MMFRIYLRIYTEKQAQVTLHLFLLRSQDHRCTIPPHTWVINVVLNAMVKVNQAAILLTSPGQPRHQISKAFLLQSINTKVNKWWWRGKNTYKSFFTPESSPVAPCWRASKASKEKTFPISKLSKGEEKPISTAALLSLSRRPFLVWYCTPQWSLRDVCTAQSLFWCWT